MAQNQTSPGLPSVLERRGLLYGKESARADHAKIGRQYAAAGRFADALEFFARAGDAAGIESVRADAIERGDAFLLAQVERVGGAPVDAATWRTLAERAAAAGKETFARLARERAEGPPKDAAGPDGPDEKPGEESAGTSAREGRGEGG